MFNEHGQDSKYWSATNNPVDLGSALSYIPENVWNESGQNVGLWSTGGGSSIFFSKPSWQSDFGPNDGKRDLPDVSLTAAGHDPYLLCLEGSCIPDSQGFISFWGVAGTSASAPAFAGIMALVNQQMGGPQGQANYVLYRLAASEDFSQCNGSGTSSPPANTCVFNDTTVGNNCVPGETGYPSSCTTYKSAVGYDLATGLGSVNISNLVTNWKAATFNATTTTLGMTPTTITHGAAVTANIAVTGNSGMPTGDVSLLAPNQSVPLCTSLNACTLIPGNGSTASLSVTTHLLPGGVYNIQANYPGDGNFAPSSSAPAAVTVSPESSHTTLTVASGFDGSGNPIPFTSGPYGTFMYLRADVAGQSGYGTPRGAVQFLDNGGVLNVNGQLDSTGSATTPNGVFTVGVGTRSLIANYTGEASFNPSTSSATSVSITQATSTTTLRLPSSDSNGTLIVADVDTASHGNAPSGTVTFSSDGTQLSGAVSVSGGINPTSGTAQATAYISSPISGNPTLTAIYTGDPNYAGSTSPPVFASADFVVYNGAPGGTLFNSRGTTSGTTISLSSIVAFTGTVTFTCSGLPAESTCSFSPASLDISPTVPVANSFITITTRAPHAGLLLPNQLRPERWWTAVDGVMFAGVFLLAGTRKSRARRSGAFGVVLFGFLIALAGCGGGGGNSSGGGGGSNPDPGTPIGTYVITVKGTSGTTTHTTSFQLIVQ
jgi:hypothetical protein